MATRGEAVPDGLKYHFNVIYNYPRSQWSETDDTTLAKEVTEHTVATMASLGFDKAYYHERDCLPGKNLFKELLDVVQRSQYTFVILTPGFVKDCWTRYCQMTAFKILLEKDRSERLIPVAVNLREENAPQELAIQAIVWMRGDWRNDRAAWNRITRVLTEKIPVQETFEQAMQEVVPSEETGGRQTAPSPVLRQPSLLGGHNAPLEGNRSSSAVQAGSGDLSGVPVPPDGPLDSMDGPSTSSHSSRLEHVTRPGNPASQSDAQDRYSLEFSDSDLFDGGAHSGDAGMRRPREHGQTLVQTEANVADEGISPHGDGLAQRSHHARPAPSPDSQTAPQRVVAAQGARNFVPAAPEGASAPGGAARSRVDNSEQLARSLKRKLELTSRNSEESSQSSGSTFISVNPRGAGNAAQSSRHPSHIQGSSPGSQQTQSGAHGNSFGEDESLPSIDGPPESMGIGFPPESPPTTVADGDLSVSSGNAGRTQKNLSGENPLGSSLSTSRSPPETKGISSKKSTAGQPSSSTSASAAGSQRQFLDAESEQTLLKGFASNAPEMNTGNLETTDFSNPEKSRASAPSEDVVADDAGRSASSPAVEFSSQPSIDVRQVNGKTAVISPFTGRPNESTVEGSAQRAITSNVSAAETAAARVQTRAEPEGASRDHISSVHQPPSPPPPPLQNASTGKGDNFSPSPSQPDSTAESAASVGGTPGMQEKILQDLCDTGDLVVLTDSSVKNPNESGTPKLVEKTERQLSGKNESSPAPAMSQAFGFICRLFRPDMPDF